MRSLQPTKKKPRSMTMRLVKQVRCAIFGGRTALLLALGIACSAALAQAPSDCPVKRGDDWLTVKTLMGIKEEPTRMPRPAGLSVASNAPSAFEYRLSDRGIWIFFDGDKRVRTLRFEAPFAGTIHKLRIGMTDAQMRAARGEPKSTFDGSISVKALDQREKDKRMLIEGLPDPAPRDAVRAVFNAIDSINKLPPPFLRGHSFPVGSGPLGYVRADLANDTRTIEVLITDSCVGD
jgi:hypothetical protein